MSLFTINHNPANPTRYLDIFVGANGVFSLGLGLAALYKPLMFLGAFDLPNPPKTSESHQIAQSLLTVYAARDLALGFGITSAAYYGHREIMGWSMVGVSVIAALDGTVSKRNREGGQWKHWMFVGVSLGLAGGCFGLI